MTNSSDPRHHKRIRLLKAIYSHQFPQTKPLPLKTSERDEYKKIINEIPEINKLINNYAVKFSVDKMSKIDLSILQLGMYELSKNRKTPPKVVINECIELAKEFGAEKSYQLVNGILGKFIEKK